MGIYDGDHLFHENADEYHKKNQNIDMRNKHIINLSSTGQSLKSVINVEYMINFMYNSLAETLIWEYYTTYSSAFYKVDTSNHTEVVYDDTTRKVSLLYDQSLSGDHSTQTNSNLQCVLCNKTDRINNRYYLQFDGTKRMISDINLNKQLNKPDIVNVFIVYRIKSYNGSYWTINALFGHDNSNFDKFISFGPETNGCSDLIISGTTPTDHIVIGINNVNGRSVIANHQSNAYPGVLNQFVCLSVHWDVDLGVDGSKVFCNGKLLTTFQARTSQGDNQLCFGNLNPTGITGAGLDGDIALFLLYRNRMDERSIKLHHKVFCNWYQITHDPINF